MIITLFLILFFSCAEVFINEEDSYKSVYLNGDAWIEIENSLDCNNGIRTVDDSFLIEIYFSGGGSLSNDAGTLISFMGRDSENFTDTNCNDVWDSGDSFIDCNEDQSICENDVGWSPEMGNGEYDSGEIYNDLNKNDTYDKPEDLFDENEDGLWSQDLSDDSFITLAITDDPSNDDVLSIYINNIREEVKIEGANFSNSSEFYLLQIFSDGEAIYFYINDEEIYSSSEDIMLQGANMIIGGLGNDVSMSNFWTGHIDEIRLWNGSLTSALRSMHFDYPDKLVNSMQDEKICSLIGMWSFNYNEPSYSIKDEKCRFTDSLTENPCGYESCSELELDATIFTLPGSQVTFSRKEF